MKKSIILILIFVIALIIGLCAILLGKNGSTPSNNLSNVVMPELQLSHKSVSNCKDPNDPNCVEKESIYYRIDDYNNNKDLDDIIHMVNSSYINRGDEEENNIDIYPECASKKDIYKNRYSDNGYIYYFVNDKFAVITQDLISKDLCTDKEITSLLNVYIYNFETGKYIDELELFDILGITRDDVNNRIIASLVEKGIIKDKIEYINLVRDKKMTCKSYLGMTGNLMSRCINNEDDSFVDIYSYMYYELGLRVKIPE